MTLVPMSFGDYVWLHNPESIKFECSQTLHELKKPFAGALVQNIGRSNMKITGSGKLFGEDCLRQFEELFEVFKAGGCKRLTVDGLPSVFAVFESLEITGEPKPDVLTYSFAFREVMEKAETISELYVYSRDGQTLWDISYLNGVNIDTLVSLNPQVKFPDEDLGVRRVKLC